MIFLYLKESPLGLKYLGKTERDPFKYVGSGLHWKRHLIHNGFTNKDIKTTILFQTDDIKLFNERALYFSNLYDVVNSNEFANITEERGQGGKTFTIETHPNHPSFNFKKTITKYWSDAENRNKQSVLCKGRTFSDETKQKLSIAHIGKKYSDEINKKKGRAGELNVSKQEDVRLKISQKLKGHSVSAETKRKISETLKSKKIQNI